MNPANPVNLGATRRDFLKTTALGLAAAPFMTDYASAQSSDPLQWTAVETIDALKARRISAEELMRLTLARAERLRGMNMFISIDPEKALAGARDVDRRRSAGLAVGPLAGLPLGIKDNIDSAALPTTAASKAFAGWQPTTNAPVLAALLRADGVLLGKTNLYELALVGSGPYGEVVNPYRKDATPGGSSSGTAAAIASRVMTAGLGADTGGSIRIPSAYCGCVGLRPTMGRYSTAGMIAFTWTMCTPGPLGRTVADVALLDSICAKRPAVIADQTWSGTRVGIPPYFYTELDSELRRLVDRTLESLRKAGAVLVDVDLPQNLRRAPGWGAAEAPHVLASYLREHKSRMSVFEIVEKVEDPTSRQILTSMADATIDPSAWMAGLTNRRSAYLAAVAGFFRDNSLTTILVPTTQGPAPTFEYLRELSKRPADPSTLGNRNSFFGSGAGLPCLSVPVGLTAGGLPVGMELIGPAESDGVVLRLGRELETLVGILPPPQGL